MKILLKILSLALYNTLRIFKKKIFLYHQLSITENVMRIEIIYFSLLKLIYIKEEINIAM